MHFCGKETYDCIGTPWSGSSGQLHHAQCGCWEPTSHTYRNRKLSYTISESGDQPINFAIKMLKRHACGPRGFLSKGIRYHSRKHACFHAFLCMCRLYFIGKQQKACPSAITVSWQTAVTSPSRAVKWEIRSVRLPFSFLSFCLFV